MSEAQQFSSEETTADADPRGKVMTLYEHLDELRARIVRSMAAVLIIFVGTLFFSSELINFLQGPLRSALPNLAEGAKALNFTGPMDVFISSLKVSFLVAMILGCPVWLYQFWRFLEPALFPHEKKYVLPFVFASVLLFFSGILFCYLVILPIALEFLIGLGLEVGNPIITIRDYFSVLMILILGFGLIFETPVILILLALLDLVDSKALTEYRQIVIVAILVIAALLTPPDPISQVGLAVPMYIMYEISIMIIKMIEKRGKAAAESSAGG